MRPTRKRSSKMVMPCTKRHHGSSSSLDEVLGACLATVRVSDVKPLESTDSITAADATTSETADVNG
jgi:hypothetical protein